MLPSNKILKLGFGAEGGSRTRMKLPSTDFESVASAIPPLRLVLFYFIINKKKLQLHFTDFLNYLLKNETVIF